MMMIETEAPLDLSDKRVEPRLFEPHSEMGALPQDGWLNRRARIEADWRAYLGSCPFPDLEQQVIEGPIEAQGSCVGRWVRIRTEPGYREECYLLVPRDRPPEPLPAVLVPYYDVTTPAGLGGTAGPNPRAFARHLAERGYVTLSQRWFHEGYLDRPRNGGEPLSQRYGPSVARFRRLAPGWKGLGRVVWDAGRCLDYLCQLPFVDRRRLGCMGHSLGGKMALYAAAFDGRIKAVVASEPGIGLGFSNWERPWYLGPEIRAPGFRLDHHQLLALIAPRPFLLVAGEHADGDHSWPYLNSAREVYAQYRRPSAIGMLNHRAGHTPTMASLHAAYAWFDEHLRTANVFEMCQGGAGPTSEIPFSE